MIKQFEITGKCNLACEFCYNAEQMRHWQGREISIEDIVGEVKPKDLVFLGGGEPLLYSEIEKLVGLLLAKEAEIVISTNGTIYRELPKDIEMQVSIPAFDAEVYEKITKGKRKLLGRIKNNVKRYVAGGYNLFVNVPVYNANIGEIKHIADFCRENGLALRVNPILECNGLKVSKEEIKEINKEVLTLIVNGYDIYQGAIGNQAYYTPLGKMDCPFTKRK